jgi:hypothetical protein
MQGELNGVKTLLKWAMQSVISGMDGTCLNREHTFPVDHVMSAELIS